VASVTADDRWLGRLAPRIVLHLRGDASANSGHSCSASTTLIEWHRCLRELLLRACCSGILVSVKLRPGLTIEDSVLNSFAERWGIERLALYGSAIRDDFGPASDVDMLVEFLPDRTPGLLQLAQMELELEAALGRAVELRTYEDLSPFFRDDVAATARPVCAA
jgi:predicted nucleotidyltransferase